MLIRHQKRILSLIPTLIGTLWITSSLLAQPQPLPQVIRDQPAQIQTDPNPSSSVFTLGRTPIDKLEQALRQICGPRFHVESPHHYIFTTNKNNVRQQCAVTIEPQSRRIHFSGDQQLSEQVFQIIVAIDQPPPQGRGRQIIPFQYTPPDLLVRLFEVHRIPHPQSQACLQPQPRDVSVVRQLTPPPSDPNSNPIQQVTHQFQDDGGMFGGFDPVMPIPGGIPGFQAPVNPGVVALPEDFRYMIIPQLEVVVVEADGVRLHKFTEMIRQLEELSKVQRPQIEIVYLNHINNVSLNLLLREALYRDMFAIVPGNVTFTPMVSPNGMILTGWGEAMETAKEVLKAIDVPLSTEHSRLHFFKLQHISVTQASTALGQVFPPTMGGTSPRIQLYAYPRANVLIVQAAPDELELAKKVILELDVDKTPLKLQVDTVKLQHSLAPDVVASINAVVSGAAVDGAPPALQLLIQSETGQKLIESGTMANVTVSAHAQNNVVLIRAPESCMTFVKELIALLDSASPEAEVKIFPIENSDAVSLEAMLTRLIPSNIEGLPGGVQLPFAAEEDDLIPLRFAVDVRTNCIIAVGSRSSLLIVEALIESLDREDSLTHERKVYFLKNMMAVNVAETVNAFITDRLNVQRADGGGVISSREQLASAVIVIPDAQSNSLILSGSPDKLQEIIELIEEIDKSPQQVVIRVLIAEITLSDNKEWATELGFQDPIFSKRSPGTGLWFNNLSQPTGTADSSSVATQLLSNFGGAARDASRGGLAFAASSDYINIMIRALQEKNRIEVLGSPQVATMNNKPATVSVGQIVPRDRGSEYFPTTQSTRLNVVDTPVELSLMIIPNISPDGTIVMAVQIRKETLGDDVTIANVRLSTIDSMNVVTTISAANNQTAVLGGLIRKEVTKNRKKVPILGDTPVIGKLFRHEVDTTVRKELLLLLTPRIVDGSEDLDQIRQMEMARMNWCLNNVVDVYGEVGAYDVVGERPYIGNAPVVSPGHVPQESLTPIDPKFLAPVLPKRH